MQAPIHSWEITLSSSDDSNASTRNPSSIARAFGRGSGGQGEESQGKRMLRWRFELAMSFWSPNPRPVIRDTRHYTAYFSDVKMIAPEVLP